MNAHLSDTKSLRPRLRRRGTILLLVLGALAMVLILTVVYAALGKGDRTTARAVVSRAEAVDAVDVIGEHILGTVRDDVFDTVPDLTEARLLTGTNLVRSYSTERSDIPVTDGVQRSAPSLDPVFTGLTPDEQTLLRFTPTGGHSTRALWPESIAGGDPDSPYYNDPRIAGDPWLAALRPTDLGEESKSFLPNSTYFLNPFYVRALDWPQISNVAPDGRFVNLFHLRNRFDAPSLDLTRDPVSGDPRLVVFGADGLIKNAGDGGDFVHGLAGVLDRAGNEIAPDDTGLDWNTPAHWTMHQRAMYRPIAELERMPSSVASDPRNWRYSYADADGDGLIDSRWFELVDAGSGVSELPFITDPSVRYFVAARIIDLSGAVNVNTATDFVAAPTLEARAGEGPHEVSLFSLLHMGWHAQAVSRRGPANEIFYGDVFLGGGAAGDDYSFMDDVESVLFGRKSAKRVQQSVRAWEALRLGTVPTASNRRGEEPVGVADVDESNDMSLFTLALDPIRRKDTYAAYGSVPAGLGSGGNSRVGPFGTADLIELLTYHGANDPAAFSALEQAFLADNRNDPDLRSRGLLRSDRSLAAEVGVLQDATPTGPLSDGEINRLARAQLDIRSLLTTVSGARPLRSRFVDANGVLRVDETDRRIRLDTAVLGSPVYLAAPDQAVQEARLLTNTFEVYLRTLAPHLSQTAWPGLVVGGSTPTADEQRTLFYGHQGPEAAVRLAAHSAVNFRDLADAPFADLDGDGVPDEGVFEDVADAAPNGNGDGTLDAAEYAARRDEPSSALLWLTSNAARRTLAVNARGQAGGPFFDLIDSGRVLDADALLGAPSLASLPAAVSHEALTVFGVEAQPFLSEVVYMNAFWDAPRGEGIGGDNFFSDGASPNGEFFFRRTPFPTGEPAAMRGMVSVNGDVDGANPDFLFQIVVFQLFNPFDVPVSLDRFYIEWADSLYVPNFASGTGTTLAPGASVLLFATNPNSTNALGSPASPFNLRLAGTGVPGAPTLDEIIAGQFGNPAQMIRMDRFSAQTGLAVTGLTDLLVGSPDGGVELASSSPDDNRVNGTALLWWDLGSRRSPGTLSWRRDDLLADRLSDQPGVQTVLDQRLNLRDVDLSSFATVQSPIGIVPNALEGFRPDVRAAGPEDVPGAILDSGLENLNVDGGGQHSVVLWGSLRRHDDLARGGRAAVRTSAASGLFEDPRLPPTGPPTPGVIPSNTEGSIGLLGVPAGALPATAFEGGGAAANLRESAENPRRADVLSPTRFHAVQSFQTQPFATVTTVAETRKTLSALFAQLRNRPQNLDMTDPDLADAIADRYHHTLQTGPMDPLRAALDGTVMPPVPLFPRRSEIPTPASRNGEAYEGSSYIRPVFNGREFLAPRSNVPTLRVGDLLTALAVGPYRAPLETAVASVDTATGSTYPAAPALRLAAYENEWVTLGEILAKAEGFADTLPAGGGGDAFEGLRDPATGAAMLDRGHLFLDRFVPFYDADADGTLDTAGDGDGDGDTEVDRVRGLGIPLAATIFDLCQAGGELPDRAYGGIDSAVPGLINVNTAAPSVLRTLPGMLTDADDPLTNNAANLESWQWSRRLQGESNTAGLETGFANAFLSVAPAEPRVDVGATVLAYREPATGHVLISGVTGPNLHTEIAYDMGPRGVLDPANGDRLVGVENARGLSEITGLRTSPGILSLGELWAARVGPAGAAVLRAQHGMTGVAQDMRTIGAVFVDNELTQPNVANAEQRGRAVGTPAPSPGDPLPDIATLSPSLMGDLTLYDADSPLFAVPVADQVPDDYTEQLAQINMLLNSASTGSDYFAAWFVVHGFEDDDVEDLSDAEPLVPSFRARYLLLMDRSNVVRPGDRPRVLAFVQLPYTETPLIPETP